MTLWPMAQGDQAINAALLSTRKKLVAFELLQIRKGEALGPPARGGGPLARDIESIKAEFIDILIKTRGHEGSVMRKNAESLAAEIREERDGKAAAVITELSSI